MGLQIASTVKSEDLGIDRRHLMRWIGSVVYEYWREADGWHVVRPGQEKALVFPCAQQLSAFWLGMAVDFGMIEPETRADREDNCAARIGPEM